MVTGHLPVIRFVHLKMIVKGDVESVIHVVKKPLDAGFMDPNPAEKYSIIYIDVSLIQSQASNKFPVMKKRFQNMWLVTDRLDRRSGGPHYILQNMSAYTSGRVSRWFITGIDKPDMAASGGTSHRVRQVVLIRAIGIQSERCRSTHISWPKQ